MREVSDAFLLNMAEVSATLIGLFLVGVFFYVETGLQRLGPARGVLQPYFRAGTRIVLILYAFTLFLSLGLVVLTVGWNRLIFLVLSVLLVAANIDTARRIRPVAKVTRSHVWVATEVVGTVADVVLVTLPWLLGGLHPTREDLRGPSCSLSRPGSSA
jgi:hypothetical protein